MHLNPLLFPAPEYVPKDHAGELLWIPKYKKDSSMPVNVPKRNHRVCQSMGSLDLLRKPLVNGNIQVSRVGHSKNKGIEPKGYVHSLGDLDHCLSMRSTVNAPDVQPEDASLDFLDSPVKAAPVFVDKNLRRNEFFSRFAKAGTESKDDFSNFDSDQSTRNHSKKPSFKEECDLTIEEEDCDVDIFEEYPRQAIALNTVKNYKLKTNEKAHLFKTLTTESCDECRPALVRTPRRELLGHIPCLLFKSDIGSNKLMIYFHGNGEDIFLSTELLVHIRDNLQINILAVEYPGYSIYKGEPTEEKILQDTEIVYDYLVSELNFESKNIILFGRSIGSGPATYLASKREVGALTLMSPFTSIRGVVRDIAGKFLQYVIKERFNNLDNIAKVQCPAFIVHGMRDNFISYKHSQDLYRACPARCELILPEKMSHIEFDFHGDFTRPLSHFLRRRNFDMKCDGDKGLCFPTHLFRKPVEVAQ